MSVLQFWSKKAVYLIYVVQPIWKFYFTQHLVGLRENLLQSTVAGQGHANLGQVTIASQLSDDFQLIAKNWEI